MLRMTSLTSQPPRTELDPRAAVAALLLRAAGAAGVFITRDVTECGLSAGWLRRALERGQVVRAGRGVYRVSGSPSSVARTTMSAVRSVAGDAVVSFGSAAAWHGFPGWKMPRLPELTVQDTTPCELDHLVLHRTRCLPSMDIVRVDGIPLTTPARTLIDVAGQLDVYELMRLVDDVICAGLTSRGWLYGRSRALRRGRRNTGHVVRLTAPDAGPRFRSWLERKANELYLDGGIPTPEWNVAVRDRRGRIGEVDNLWQGPRTVIAELEGLRFHDAPAKRRKDAERFNRLGRVADIVLRFTWQDVVQRPDYVLATLREALDLP